MNKMEFLMRTVGKTQGMLGNEIGRHRVTVNRYVRGKGRPDKDRARKIARSLNWPEDQCDELFEEITEVK